MTINNRIRKSLQAAFVAHARGLVAERSEYPKLNRTFTQLIDAIVENAKRKGGDPAAQAAQERIDAATAKIEGDAQQVKDAREHLPELLFPLVAEQAELGIDEPQPFPEVLGNWTLVHRLVQVRCVKETPPALGEDEMLFTGTYSYASTGLLKFYMGDFDQGDVETPNTRLAAVQILPGKRTYTALHTVSEEDVFGATGAMIAATAFVFFLDLLLELGILLAKAALKAKLMSSRPDNVPVDEWEEYVDSLLEEFGKVAQDAGSDLIGILAEWLADALGPEMFPPMTSEIEIDWKPPVPPVWRRVQCEGTQTVQGVPVSGIGAGSSLMLEVPLKRAGGGEYHATLMFDIVPGLVR